MKIKLFKNLEGYTGLRSAVFSSYLVAFSPLLTIVLGGLSVMATGEIFPLGLLSRQIYNFAILFPLLFLATDLYPIIIGERKFRGFKETLKSHPELFILLGFLVWNIIATLIQLGVFGSSKAYTTIVQPLGIQEGLFAFVIYALCLLMAFWVKNENIVKNILSAFMLTALILAVFALFDPYANFYFHDTHNSVWAGMFLNSNHFSYYLTLATLLSAMGVMLSRVRWKWILSIVLLSIFCVLMMLVDTFGSTLAVFITLILTPIILCIFKKKFSWKYLLPLGIFTLSTFVVLLFAKQMNSVYVNFFSQIGDLLKDFFTVASAPTSEEASHAGTDRWSLWLEAFNEIKDSPIIGTGNVLLRPHNEYLQFAQVWGLPSLLLYLSAFVVIFVRAIKKRANLSDLTLTLLFCVGGFMISAMFGNTMPHTTPFFAFFLGFLIGSMKQKTEVTELP